MTDNALPPSRCSLLIRCLTLCIGTAAVGCKGDTSLAQPSDGSAAGADALSSLDGAGSFDGANSGDGGTGGMTSLSVELTPEIPSATVQRINFAIPTPPGRLATPDQIRIVSNGVEVPTARRTLANWWDGSLRSVQIQVDLAVPAAMTLTAIVGETATAANLALVPVEQTLTVADGTQGPRVWATLPASWLAASGVAGPATVATDVAGTALGAWNTRCDYAAFDTTAFLADQATAGSWLYDRATALYRGYQRTGSVVPLRSAYREAAIYRAGITGTGAATRIGVPGAVDDLKYHYAQGMAVHYLLTGDDRFREAAEGVATRSHDLWSDPGYAGGSDFWTERHAGFALLAYEWAAAVSDDKPTVFAGWAADAFDGYVALQETYPLGYADTSARCFAHSADAHGETFGYFGCSPWMSAILADGLDAYARHVELGGDTARAAIVRGSLVKLGRIIARDGRDPATGRPHYWMGVGTTSDEADSFDEHWGESAYVVAMAWHWDGRKDATLKAAADALVAGFGANGEVGQLRSFNWQCRSAVMTPVYLLP